jgi:hypothetical protein
MPGWVERPDSIGHRPGAGEDRAARQRAIRRTAACMAWSSSSPSASNRWHTAWRPARGIKHEKITRPPGSPSIVYRVTPSARSFPRKTAQLPGPPADEAGVPVPAVAGGEGTETEADGEAGGKEEGAVSSTIGSGLG